MKLSNYDLDFSDPTALKLRWNREAWQSENSVEPKQCKEHETVIVQTNAPYDRTKELRTLVAQHPGHTPEEAEQGLRELGF